MSFYMLDTNAVSDLMRDPMGEVGQKLALAGEGDVCISVIVLAELRFGLAKTHSPRLAAQLALILKGLPVVAWEPPADLIYGDIRTGLERQGRIIGANDMLIAAHALSLDCILVTGNEDEFRRVPGLRVENWLKAEEGT